MTFHTNQTGDENKIPDYNAQFYMDICAVLSWSSLFARIRHEELFLLIWLLTISLLSESVLFAPVCRAGTNTFYGPVHIK